MSPFPPGVMPKSPLKVAEGYRQTFTFVAPFLTYHTREQTLESFCLHSRLFRFPSDHV